MVCARCNKRCNPYIRHWCDTVLRVVQVLQRLGFEESTIGKTVGSQAHVLAFFYWLTFCVLRANKPQFQPMESIVTGTI